MVAYHINSKGLAAPCSATERRCPLQHVEVNLPIPDLAGLVSTVNGTNWDLNGRLTEEEQAQERFRDLGDRAAFLHKEYERLLRNQEELKEIEEQESAKHNDPLWLASPDGAVFLKKKEIEENDGYHEFDALFDNEGNLLNAKKAHTKFGVSWMIFAPEDKEQRDIIQWFNPSNAQTESRAEANNRKKGFYIGTTEEKAYTRIETKGMPYTGQVQKDIVVYRERNEPGEVRIKDNGLN